MGKILKISIIVILLGVFGRTSAQHNQPSPYPKNTSVTVSSDHKAFWLFLDDVLQNEKSVMSIKVEAIPEGEHYLRVEIDDADHHTIGQLVNLQQANNNYWVDNQRHMFGIFLGHGNPRPEAIVRYVRQQTPYHGNPQHGQPGNPYGQPGNPHGQYGNQPPHPNPQHPQHSAYPQNNGMPSNDFNQALNLIKNQSFETSKLNMAKQVIANNYLTVSQIEQICNVFDYESTKLDFAKSAYNHCADKEKYYLINNVFQFESSKQSLNEFIQKAAH